MKDMGKGVAHVIQEYEPIAAELGHELRIETSPAHDLVVERVDRWLVGPELVRGRAEACLCGAGPRQVCGADAGRVRSGCGAGLK